MLTCQSINRLIFLRLKHRCI